MCDSSIKTQYTQEWHGLSLDFAMISSYLLDMKDWKKKVEEGLKSGVDSSKRLFDRAKERARDIGDYSVLSLEIRQLQARHDDLVSRLGSSVFHLLVEEGRGSISSRTIELRDMLAELEDVSTRLAEKREALQHLDAESDGEHASADE